MPNGLTADDIYFRARQAATARIQPKFVEYHVDSSYQHAGTLFVDRFSLRYRESDRKVVGYTIPLTPEEDRKRLAGINILIFAMPVQTAIPTTTRSCCACRCFRRTKTSGSP